MSEYYITKYDCYVSHSGIQGMKWGIRRYQNEDGTLTPEGRIRYGKQAAKAYFKQAILKRKQERAKSFKTYQKLDRKIHQAEERESFKEGKLSNEDKRKGRYTVAKFRNTKSHVESGIAGVGTGLTTAAYIHSLAAAPVASFGAETVALGASAINPLLGVSLAVAAGGLGALAARSYTHGHYYKKQAEANAPIPAPVEETKKRSSGRYPYGNGAGAKKK